MPLHMSQSQVESLSTSSIFVKRDDTLNELTILSLLIGSRFIDLITYVWSVVIMAVIKWLFQDWSVLSINCRAIKINDSELGLTEFLLYKNHENMSVSQCFTRKMSWYKKVNSTGNWPFYNLPNALPLINRVALLRMWKNTTLISWGTPVSGMIAQCLHTIGVFWILIAALTNLPAKLQPWCLESKPVTPVLF